MARVVALVLGVGLAAAKTVELPSVPVSTPIVFPGGGVGALPREPTHQKSRHTPAAVGHRQLSAPPAVVKRDGSFYSSDYSQYVGGHGSVANYGPTGHSSGGYSTGGHGTGGYTGGYSGYGGDGYAEATTYENGGGGFLGNIGKYGLIIIPILLGITLLFLFPSVINVAGTGRDNRAIGDHDDLSDDLLLRAMTIYTSVSEDPLCVNRLFCEMGSTLGHTSFANRTLQYIGYFYPTKNDNLLVLKKAAQAKDPQCQMLACKAWEATPEPPRHPESGGVKGGGSTGKTGFRH